MKNFKTKIFSIVICLCLCLSLFSGCSLISKKDTVNTDEVALTIGNTKVTKKELVSAYYSFYNQNYYYFMSAGESTILKVFYESVIAREIVLEKANQMIADGELTFSQEDVDEIWNDVYLYVYNQIDTKEKNLLLEKDSDKEKLPERLQEPEEEEKKEEAFKYSDFEYKFEPIVPVDYSGTSNIDVKANFEQRMADFETNLYKVNTTEDEEEEPVWSEDIAESEKADRQKAYQMYLADLILSAKANGNDSRANVVLKAEIERLLESYYESALYTKYQEYMESTITGSDDGYFSDEAIVKKYKELLNASKESNTLKDNYIKVVTSSSNESLILYHYEDKYVYFTVNHILVSWDEETLETLKVVEGYDAAKDSMFRDYYESVRETYYSTDLQTSYRDETTGLKVKDGDVDAKKSIADIVAEYNTSLTDAITAEVDKLKASDVYASMSNDEKLEAEAQAETRARTLLFNKLAWKYSGDTGSLKNKFGFTVSSETDNHGSFVKDFANGAREMYQDYVDGNYDIGETIKLDVISDYGVHLMMLTGVYTFDSTDGEVVSVEGKTDAQIVKELKSKYVSNLTEQSIYEYVHDMLKDALVGEKGTFFSDHINELVKEYQDAGLIKYLDKLTYDELNDAIN